MQKTSLQTITGQTESGLKVEHYKRGYYFCAYEEYVGMYQSDTPCAAIRFQSGLDPEKAGSVTLVLSSQIRVFNHHPPSCSFNF